MPLGILYIAKHLENQRRDVKVYDLNHTDEMELMCDIVQNKPSVIGISCLTSPMVKETNRLLTKINDYDFWGELIVGGYHPTICPDDFREAKVVFGQGESHFGQVDLDKLGKPARHLLDSSNYNLMMDGMRTSTIITSRGCPNNCVFCGNINRFVRKHNVLDIESELYEAKTNKYDAVYFLDDVFTLDKNRAKYISNVCNDVGLKFRLTTRANYTNDDLIKHLSKNGLDVLSMGVESGNPEILANVGKNQTMGEIREAVNIAHNYGVKTKGFFILGLPGETEKTANQTIRFAQELRNLGMEYQDFYPLVPFPGTAIWNNPDKYGIKIIDRDYTNYLQATKGEPKIVCETKDLSADKISSLLKYAKGLQ